MQGRRAVLYQRVSHSSQVEDGISLEAQRTKLRSYAVTYDLEVVAEVEDAGISAKSLARPGLQHALRLLDDGVADVLVVTKLDRLTRSVKDLGFLVEEYFSKPTCSLASVEEALNTRNAAGRLVLNLLASVASWEREICGERTKTALAQLKSDGVRLGREGYGWRRVDDVDNEGRKIVVAVEEERTIIDRVCELRRGGLTLRAIAAVLTSEGHATKRGGAWQPATLRKMLLRAEPALSMEVSP